MALPAITRRPRRIIARTLAFGTSALVAAALLAWSPSATTGWNQGSAEGTLWQLLNGARTNNGMAPVQQHGTLVGLARWRSSDMLNRDYFSHTIPGCGCLVYTYYDQNGLRYDWAGENIGWNSGLDDSSSPVRVHEKFMASPGHRANVLDARFTHGGVGAAAADDRMYQGYVQDTRMYTELFMQAPAAGAPASPSGGGGSTGGGGGGGGGGGYAQPVAQATPKPEPKPKEMRVEAPRRPTSTAGLDGVMTTVVERTTADLVARLAADDALGVPAAVPSVANTPLQTAATRPMEVTAARPADAGLFDGVVGAVLGFLFG
ncbi:MAG: CAP domain-containing protein [Chloroflexota bacterium]|nr:CAP domain-containing protein [Chloroflexota bacterium]